MASDIDIVICWVDGSDPRLAAKRSQYGDSTAFQSEDIAGATRFANCGEIHWCVASINKFAPWARKIFIVTDNQDPRVESSIPVEIVDHSVLYNGYEQYLPTFNSIAIETLIWRIPGLSDRFIYFNDDFMLLAPVKPEDFFDPFGNPVVYSEWRNIAWIKLLRDLKPGKNGRRCVTVKHSLLNAARLAGQKGKLLFLCHTPKSFNKAYLEELYSANDKLLIPNISHRFRNLEQYRVDEFVYLQMWRDKKLEVRSPKGLHFYMEPKNKPDYIQKKLAKLARGQFKFGCLNSVDKASAEDFYLIKTAIECILR